MKTLQSILFTLISLGKKWRNEREIRNINKAELRKNRFIEDTIGNLMKMKARRDHFFLYTSYQRVTNEHLLVKMLLTSQKMSVSI